MSEQRQKAYHEYQNESDHWNLFCHVLCQDAVTPHRDAHLVSFVILDADVVLHTRKHTHESPPLHG